jgi:enamine deaminase RidA (YjgF/YER057c/UK114 family)
MSVEARVAQLGIAFPEAATPLANYVLARVSGDRLYVSGHLGKRDGDVVTGRVDEHITRHDAYELARGAAIDMLASARAAVGTLDRLVGVVKVTGFVNSSADFTDQSAVINGASDLLVEVFGPEHGRHARSAVGVAQLPRGAAVEVEAIFEVDVQPETV